MDVKLLKDFHFSAEPMFRAYFKNDRKTVFELEEQKQWPLLRLLDDWSLPIYKDAMENDVTEFIFSIRDEKEIRHSLSLGRISQRDYHGYLYHLILKRLNIFRVIFQISDDDIKQFQKDGLSWKKIAFGGIIAAGIVGGTIIFQKHTEKKEEDKKK